MNAFDKAVDLIKGFEGFVDHVYDDGFGNATVGYGDTDPAIIKKYKKGISEPEAAALLAERVQQYWDGVAGFCTRPPTDNQHIAYTSLAYNIGLGGFEGSTTLRLFNEGDISGAAAAILLWNKANGQVVDGLVKRRNLEHDIFLAGEAPTPAPLPPTENSATIKLISLNSALALDVNGMSVENGVSIVQYYNHDGTNQDWVLVPIADGIPGEVAIVSALSGKVLDVAMWSTENGARVQQWEYLGGANQRWIVHSTGNVLEFQNVHSGKFLDVRGESVDAGMDIQQWDRRGSLNQMWMRVRQERTAQVNIVQPGPTPPVPDTTVPPPPVENFDVGSALRALGGFPFGNEEDVYGFQAGFSFWDLALDGDAGPETVRAIKYAQENGGRCGKFFTFSEFACKHCGRCRIWREQVRALDKYREAVGPVSIVSGTRCDEYNASVGGATNSQHRPYPNNRGTSTASDVPGAVTVGWLRERGWFSGIGYVPSEGNIVVHVDSRGDGPNNTTGGTKTSPTTWEY